MQIGSRALVFPEGQRQHCPCCLPPSLPRELRTVFQGPSLPSSSLSDSVSTAKARELKPGMTYYSSSLKRLGSFVWSGPRVGGFKFWLKYASVLTFAPETHSFLCALNLLDVLLFIPLVLLSHHPKCL